MERTPVTSRALKSVGYDASSGVLEIEFQTGRIYQYLSVPSSLYEWFMRIPGKGAFVTRVLEPKYHGREVSSEQPSEFDLEAQLRASLGDSDSEK